MPDTPYDKACQDADLAMRRNPMANAQRKAWLEGYHSRDKEVNGYQGNLEDYMKAVRRALEDGYDTPDFEFTVLVREKK